MGCGASKPGAVIQKAQRPLPASTPAKSDPKLTVALKEPAPSREASSSPVDDEKRRRRRSSDVSTRNSSDKTSTTNPTVSPVGGAPVVGGPGPHSESTKKKEKKAKAFTAGNMKSENAIAAAYAHYHPTPAHHELQQRSARDLLLNDSGRKSWQVYSELEYYQESELIRLNNFFRILREHLPITSHEGSPIVVPGEKSKGDISFVEPPARYKGLRLTFPLTPSQTLLLLDWFRQGKTLHSYYANSLVENADEFFKKSEIYNICDVTKSPSGEPFDLTAIVNPSTDPDLPPEPRVIIVGDLHGQYADFLHILRIAGAPSTRNKYVFNGDFVDRGPQSVEICLALFAFIFAYPGCVFLNRGNHEDIGVSERYGFKTEIRRKYGNDYGQCLYEKINIAFSYMPIFTVVREPRAFVVHGGIPTDPKEMKLDKFESLSERGIHPQERYRTNISTAKDLFLMELLWNDPQENDGVVSNPRGGVAKLFGPDIVEMFCKKNGLEFVIRSHQCVRPGVQWTGDRCCTVFSASDYYDVGSNDGAILFFGHAGEIAHKQYSAPPVSKQDALPNTPEFDIIPENRSKSIVEMLNTKGGTGSKAMTAFRRAVGKVKVINMSHAILRDVCKQQIVEVLAEKLDALKIAFVEIDKRDNKGVTGKITTASWAEALKIATGLDVAWVDMADELIHPSPTNGLMSYKEFLRLYTPDPVGGSAAFGKLYKYRVELEAMFSYFDQDNSGTIEEEEFISGMEIMNAALGVNKMPEEEIRHVMRAMDKDGNGSIDINEFMESFRVSASIRPVNSDDEGL